MIAIPDPTPRKPSSAERARRAFARVVESLLWREHVGVLTLRRAQAQYTKGDPLGALELAQHVDRDPKTAAHLVETARVLSATCLLTLGDARASLRQLDGVVLAPTTPREIEVAALQVRAHASRLSGDYAALRTACARLLELAPVADHELLAAIASKNLGDLALALEHLDRAVASGATDQLVLIRACYRLLAGVDGARSEVEQCLAAFPSLNASMNASEVANRGWAYEILGERDMAFAALKRSAAMRERFFEVRQRLAWIEVESDFVKLRDDDRWPVLRAAFLDRIARLAAGNDV